VKFSYDWLCELAGFRDVSVGQTAELLTMAGWNVEDVRAVDLSPLLVGRIVAQEPHPSSRKPLWVHQVDLGDHVRQIVAGVDNAGPGALVPVALPGVTVPSGTTVRDGKIAGVEARGMLCSADELLIGDDHAGILLLDTGRPGQRLEELIPSDAVLEVEVTPNRPDCLGHLGLARELAAALGRQLGRDFMPPFTGGAEPAGTELIDVSIDAPDLCRRYIGAPITGVRVGPSPLWLRRRLFLTGLRPISNVVDVTNYVALEYGQPLHAFDLAKVSGRRIIVRRARTGEKLLCLDGETRTLTPEMLVIADAERPVAIAGIIGGEESAVTGSTTDLLLEAANFDGVSVRATSRTLRLRTEASTRFEKGLSPELAQAGARRAAALIAELTRGEVHLGWADQYPRPQEPTRVHFGPAEVDALLGVHVPLREMEAILRRLDFQVRVQDDGDWDVLPPVFRLDVTIPEDVTEEVGRIYGYDKVAPTLPGSRRSFWTPAEPGQERRLDSVRHSLAGAGFTEVVTPALTAGSLLDRLGIGERAMRVINPVSDDQDTLRTALIPSLLRVAAHNRNQGRPAVALFEVARAYLRLSPAQSGEYPAKPGEGGPRRLPAAQPEEPLRMAAVRTGLGDAEAGRLAFLDLKGALERSLSTLAPVEMAYEPTASALYHPGRCARVLLCGNPAGHVGELHPTVVAELGLEGRVVAVEIDLEPVLALGGGRRARPLPRYPAVSRDLAVVVTVDSPAAVLLETIRRAGGDLLESVTAFDEYRGTQVPAGYKSVAFAMTFRSPERTLTDAEVDARLEAVRAALRKRHDASFR
jgi:phenylalanyl-tRNA synthetase beta chain